MTDGADVLAPDRLLGLLDTGAVDQFEDTLGPDGVGGHYTVVRGHDRVVAIALAQRRRQLRADLAQGSGSQDPPHDALPVGDTISVAGLQAIGRRSGR